MANVGTAPAGRTLVGTGNGSSPTFVQIGTNSGLTAHGMVVAEGNGAFVATAAGTDGQIPIAATGADPAFASLTSSDNSITFTTGANTLSLQVAGGTSSLKTLTGNSGGALSPTAGNINITGTGSITVAGAGSTLTPQLTGLTNHNVLIGAGTATITNVAPSATSGVPLISQGSSLDPAFGTAVVAGGGTGAVTLTAHGVLLGQGTSPITATSVGATGTVLAGNTGADPTFQTIASIGGITTITGNSGGAESPSSGNFNILGTGSITVAGSANTETVQLTGLTNHSLLVGAGTATITNIGPTATSGQILQSQGSSADPAFSTATYPSTTTINQLLYSSAANVVNGLATTNNASLSTNATGVPTWLALTDGQVVVGSTIGAPAAATLSAGTGISITNGHNSISIAASAGVATTYNADSGSATPSANTLTLAGSGSIATSATGSTVTTALTGLTNHSVLVGAGTATITKIAPSATTGIPLVSNGSSSDPSFTTASIAGGGTNATSMSTSTGIVKYDGTRLVTSTTAKIDSSNRQTNSSQPCFCAYKSANTTNVTGDGTSYTPIFDTVRTDQASNYNSSTGVFTAPVTGLYLFQWCIALGNLTASFTEFTSYILTTSKSIKASDMNVGAVRSPFNEYFRSFSVVCPMSATDTASIQIIVSGSTKTVTLEGSSDMWTYFTGCLLC